MIVDQRTRQEAAGATGRRDLPSSTPLALPRLMRQLWQDRLAMLTDAAERYGDAVRLSMGPKNLYFFNHPDHAKHVLTDNSGNYHKGMGLAQAKRILGDGLLTSEGEVWREQRRALQPAFRRERIAGFAGVVADEADALMTRLDGYVGGAPVDIVTEMTSLTLGVLGRALLDADLAPLRLLSGAFEVAQEQAMFELVTLGAVPLWLPLARHRRFRAARRQLELAVLSLIAAREQAGWRDRGDVISLMLQAHADEPDSEARQRKLRDELVTILLAGHETTASTLSWAWYLISRHPQVGRTLRAEAAEVFGDRSPTYADLARLPYATMVIQETMRLYPPVWGLPRRALGPDEIGGHKVPAGADIMISPYTLHRHPGFWPDAESFRPERFEQAMAGSMHRYAYIPFGAGPRVCVGSHLGMMEATLVVAMAARLFRFEFAGDADPHAEAMLSLRARGGLPMRVLRA